MGDMSESAEGGQRTGVDTPVDNGYFARRKIHDHELPAIMRKHIYTGAMGASWMVILGDVIFTSFMTAVGMLPIHIGTMQAISLWFVGMQFISASFTQKTGRRKEMWFWSAMSDRLLRLVGILYAFILWRSSWHFTAPLVLIYFMCLSSFFGQMAAPPWFSWLADIIPEDKHGAFWGRRSAWIAAVVTLTLLPAAYFTDRFSGNVKVEIMVIIFVLATVAGVIDLLIHGTIPEPHMKISKQNHFFHHFLEPIRDRHYRPFLIFGIFWNFAMVLGGSLVSYYFVEELGLKDHLLKLILVFTIPTLLGGSLTGDWSGKLVDRIGAKRVLFIGHIFWSSLPFFWIFAAPQWGLIWILISSIVGGTSATASMTAANKMMIRIPPHESRPMYIASYSTLASFSAGLGALAAGVMHHHIKHMAFSFVGIKISGFDMLFIVSFALRLLTTLILVPRIKDIPCAKNIDISGNPARETQN